MKHGTVKLSDIMKHPNKSVSPKDYLEAGKGELSYVEKKKIADQYLMRLAGTCWDDLTDVNSLHDCDSEEEIYAACEDRLNADMTE